MVEMQKLRELRVKYDDKHIKRVYIYNDGIRYSDDKPLDRLVEKIGYVWEYEIGCQTHYKNGNDIRSFKGSGCRYDNKIKVSLDRVWLPKGTVKYIIGHTKNNTMHLVYIKYPKYMNYESFVKFDDPDNGPRLLYRGESYAFSADILGVLSQFKRGVEWVPYWDVPVFVLEPNVIKDPFSGIFELK